MSVSGKAIYDFFISQGYIHAYPRGHVICFQGDKFNQVFMVMSGIVKFYDIDGAGSERTISFFANPDVFPVIWLLSEPPPGQLYYYEAVADTTCLIAPASEARAFIAANPGALLMILDSLTQAYINLIGRVQNLERSHLGEKLAFVLYWLAQRIGTIDGQVARIDAIITQEDIARLAGVTRESMSLAINKMGSDVLWREKHSTYINLSKLSLNSMPAIYPRDLGS